MQVHLKKTVHKHWLSKRYLKETLLSAHSCQPHEHIVPVRSGGKNNNNKKCPILHFSMKQTESKLYTWLQYSIICSYLTWRNFAKLDVTNFKIKAFSLSVKRMEILVPSEKLGLSWSPSSSLWLPIQCHSVALTLKTKLRPKLVIFSIFLSLGLVQRWNGAVA